MWLNLFNGFGFGIRNDIVVWARKKTGVPVVRVISVKEAEEFLNKYPTFVLGVFDKFEVHFCFGLFCAFAYCIKV